MHQGTNMNESIDTSVTSSMIENAFNNSSINEMGNNLQFLFNGKLDPNSDIMKDADKIIGSSSGLIRSFSELAKDYLQGGKMVFPQIIDGVNYSKSISATMKFISPYGSKYSIFLRCFVPIMHLLAFALPKQLSATMYTFPYLIRVFQQGWYNSDLAVMNNLRINRGGNDDTCWTVDGLATEYEVQFDILPLYANLMSSSTTDPVLYLQNSSLSEYLATLCGVDLKDNNLDTKIDIAKAAITNKFTDIPANLGRAIMNYGLYRKVTDFTSITN